MSATPPDAGDRTVTIVRGDLLEPSLVPGPPSFHDRVRFRLALGMLVAVGALAFLLVVAVAAGGMTAADAKELALAVVALFGVVAPIIGFYFAAKERG